MKRERRTLVMACLLAVLVVAPACTPTATPVAPVATETTTPDPEPDASLSRTPGRIVFSEMIPGIPGNNNFEFIELYNAGTTPVDLRGWSLWYLLADGQEEKQVYRWSSFTEVPGYGHFLMVREGQDAGVMPDARFGTPLFERKGGLALRDRDGNTIDALGWGEAVPGFFETNPAAIPANGSSLERLPGAAGGSGQDSGDNAADFSLLAEPDPQSRGSVITPLPDARLDIEATAPEGVAPGKSLDFTVTARNLTGQALEALRVVIPVVEGFGVLEVPAGAVWQEDDGLVIWALDSMAAGEERTFTLTLQSPWSYQQINWGGYYIESEAWPLRAYGALVPVSVGGGAIPIAVARGLDGAVVTVEGVATMYTGGFFAGTTGTKFYLQDESGGIQAYCAGGAGLVNVRIGDRVQVTGMIERYRDSMEIIPGVYPDHVQVLDREAVPVTPAVTTGQQANQKEESLGTLIEVEGLITRFEEFSYSYELDVLADDGETVLVYLDKETHVNPEFIDVGNRYRITGIHELYNAKWQLEPRLEEDFQRVYPPELMAEISAQNSVAVGDVITYTITAYNHTAAPLTDVTITANVPGEAVLVDVLDGGTGSDTLTWQLGSLDGAGGSASVSFVVQPGQGAQLAVQPAVVTAAEWEGEVLTQAWLTFIGSGVPVWAIQGDGFSSPYVRNMATTEGIVTGVFPDFNGFWLQSLDPDDNPATSEGLFVLTAGFDYALAAGDRVQVTGKVREKSLETLLYVTFADDLSVLESGVPLPDAVELDPPQDASASRAYFEALEGMLVQVTSPAVAVSPMSSYGEYVIVREEWGIERIMRNEPKGMAIFVDDGSNITHLDATTMPYALKSGDVIHNVMGPLAFTYDNYKIQPLAMPDIVSATVDLQEIAPAAEGQISVATFNVENFFDVKDPHPSSPPRPSIGAYRLKVAKTANTVLAMGAPTVVAFQEVENIGVLEDVAEVLVEAGVSYTPLLIEGFDSRGIDVGYLVREDQVSIVDVSQHEAPEGLTSRPPLWLQVVVPTADGERTLHVLNNHFLSMSGGELATEPQRTAQAAWNATLIAPVLEEDAGAWVIVLGDLNSFIDAPPVDILREAGLQHAYDFAPETQYYTYIYQGDSETLDHMLISPALFEQIANVAILHSNADYPLAGPDDTSPVGLSDHDPLVVIFDVAD